MCLCASVQQVATRTKLLILQHPRERLHPFGTARLARLSLPSARIEVPYAGYSGSLCSEIEVPADAAILFPHAHAVDLETLPIAERPSLLVVLDGTWAHARRLYRDNPWLERLRHVRLHPRAPSNYRIRKEPQQDFVSTIEAIVQALQILEPENDRLGSLLTTFDTMIDRQLELLDRVQRHGRARRPRQRASRRLSPVLGADDLVAVYAEAAMPFGDPGLDRDIVQWVAVRLSTGAVFDAVLRPAAMPSAEHLRHMGIDTAAVLQGLSRAEAAARFAAFVGRAPVVAWTATALQWGEDFVGDRPQTVLKTDYCNLRNRRSSYLEHVVQREGLAAPPVACRGRAAQRLGNAVAVARWLVRERAALTAQQN